MGMFVVMYMKQCQKCSRYPVCLLRALRLCCGAEADRAFLNRAPTDNRRGDAAYVQVCVTPESSQQL